MKRFVVLFVTVLAAINSVAAREVVSINDNWKFYFSSENSADYARTISVPHTWAYDQSNILISTQPTTANYLRDIYVPAEWKNKRIFIKFYGVQSIADVMVNGHYVGEHRGGTTAFTFELTKLLNEGDNRVHLIVNDAPSNDVLPTSHEENLYGGIYRDVELIVTDKSIVSPLYYGSDGVFVECEEATDESVEGNVKVHLNSTVSSSCQLVVSAYDSDDNIVFQKIIAKAKIDNEAVTVPFEIKKAKLWSPSEPNLYTFAASVKDGDQEDRVEVTTGFRTIDYSQRGQLKINGEGVAWHGVALYHDYPHVGGAAQSRDIDADMELINELGATAIRSMTHPHNPYFYDLCNEQGKLVWVDFPLNKAPFLSEIAYYPTDRFHAQGRQMLREIVAQNYNHPSVVMWGVFSLLNTRGNNPVPYIKELNKIAKSMDSTRPTVAVSDQDGEINSITDLIVWNQNIGWDRGQFADIEVWSNLLHTKWSHMRSAVQYGQSGRMDQQSQPSEYKSTNQFNTSTWKPEGRQRVFHEEYAQRIASDSLFWGYTVNTMFDFKSSRNALGENNSGMISFDRRNRKDIFYLYKALWNKSEPTLHIADRRNGVTSDRLHQVKVYASNEEEIPTLYTSTDTVEMRKVAPAQFVADSLMLSPGLNKIVVRQGEQADSVNVVSEAAAAMETLRTLSFPRKR